MRFIYRGCTAGVMYWESASPLAGDSRHEVIRCSWEWFWGKR